MVAYDFPPTRGIGGSLRSGFFAKYLPEFDWTPHVVAFDEGQAPQPAVMRLSSLTPWQRPYQLAPYGWALALDRWLRHWDQPTGLVYVSCPPFPQAMVASRFAARWKVPLVVDFRDAWSLDPYQEGSRLKRVLYRHLFPRLERRLVGDADLLILNTPSTLDAYRDLYPGYADRMVWMPNGFDESAFAGCQGPPTRDAMLLLYAGRFGIGSRSPDNLLRGLKLALEKGARVALQVLGDQREEVKQRIGQFGMEGSVQLLPQVEYRCAVQCMASADALVLIQAATDARVQAVAGKTYDYLRAGRPVLAVAPDGDNIDLLQRHAVRLERAHDRPDSIRDAILGLYQDWRQQRLNIGVPDSRQLARFDRRALTCELASHFDRLLEARC